MVEEKESKSIIKNCINQDLFTLKKVIDQIKADTECDEGEGTTEPTPRITVHIMGSLTVSQLHSKESVCQP